MFDGCLLASGSYFCWLLVDVDILTMISNEYENITAKCTCLDDFWLSYLQIMQDEPPENRIKCSHYIDSLYERYVSFQRLT